MTTLRTPGLSYEVVRDRSNRSPLRSDIAGFIGRTHRGPVDRLERVVGWREYEALFGGLDEQALLSYAIRGYFENGGQIAYVHRVPDVYDKRACALWVIASPDAEDQAIRIEEYRCPIAMFEAASQGRWADRLVINVAFNQVDSNHIRFDLTVRTRHGERERIRIVTKANETDWTTIKQSLQEASKLIRLRTFGNDSFDWKSVSKKLATFRWLPIVLSCKCDPDKTTVTGLFSNYRACMTALLEEPEIAMVSFPTLEDECRSTPKFNSDQFRTAYTSFLKTSLRLAATAQDRMIIAGVPKDPQIDLFQAIKSPPDVRCITFYRPRLQIRDQRNGRLITLDPSGHVAGVMARIDRDRGAHFTPANVLLRDAVDLDECQRETAEGNHHDYSNQIRCVPGRGLLIWGGRTLDKSSEGRFVAHRRFIHRMVRAIRRAAEPMVFDANGPEMWRVLTRAVTTLLLEAFRGGALLGQTPEEAFYVKCDEGTNSSTEREQGRVMCEIGLALAAPMEFITFRVSISQEGEVEVFES